MSVVLQLTDVSVLREQTLLLDGVNWRVEDDERWVLLGPNGAGKTTLLQLAAAMLHPTSGTVELLGEQLGAVDVFELRPRIGLASAAVADRMPPGERVIDAVLTAAYAVVGRFRERYDNLDADRAHYLLDLMGAAHLAARRYGSLSEGERKRVAIARALMADPELLLLDEPAAGLDLGAREDLLGRIGLLAADPDGPAVILVTHHVEEISPGITHALLLRQGRVLAAGPVAEVLTAEGLGECFGVPLTVSRQGWGWTARGEMARAGAATP